MSKDRNPWVEAKNLSFYGRKFEILLSLQERSYFHDKKSLRLEDILSSDCLEFSENRWKTLNQMIRGGLTLSVTCHCPCLRMWNWPPMWRRVRRNRLLWSQHCGDLRGSCRSVGGLLRPKRNQGCPLPFLLRLTPGLGGRSKSVGSTYGQGSASNSCIGGSRLNGMQRVWQIIILFILIITYSTVQSVHIPCADRNSTTWRKIFPLSWQVKLGQAFCFNFTWQRNEEGEDLEKHW